MGNGSNAAAVRPRTSQLVQTIETVTLASMVFPIVDYYVAFFDPGMPTNVRGAIAALVVLGTKQVASLVRDWMHRRAPSGGSGGPGLGLVGLVLLLLVVGCASAQPDGSVNAKGVTEARYVSGPSLSVTDESGKTVTCKSDDPSFPCVSTYAGGWEAFTPALHEAVSVPLRAIDAAAAFFGLGRTTAPAAP